MFFDLPLTMYTFEVKGSRDLRSHSFLLHLTYPGEFSEAKGVIEGQGASE